MKSSHKKRLQQNIKDLPFSDDLKNILNTYQVKTLQDLLTIEVHNWHHNFGGFNYHHQVEVVSYLQQNELMEYLKEG